MKIPKRYSVGGQQIDVQIVKDLDSALGKCCVANGYVKLAQQFDGKEQSPTSIGNSYVHEVVHTILDTMGERELSSNEKFVCTFSSFLFGILKDTDNQETLLDV